MKIPEILARLLAEARNLSRFQNIQGSGAHPASYSVGTRPGKAKPNLCRIKKYLKDTPNPPNAFISCTVIASSLSTLNPTWFGVGLKQVLWVENLATDYVKYAIMGL
jgi:hypothetical protein